MTVIQFPNRRPTGAVYTPLPRREIVAQVFGGLAKGAAAVGALAVSVVLVLSVIVGDCHERNSHGRESRLGTDLAILRFCDLWRVRVGSVFYLVRGRTVMAGRQTPTHQSDHMLPYGRPDPVKVATIMDDYGYEAALERWSPWSPKTLSNLAGQGRSIIAKQQRSSAAMRDCVECTLPFFSRNAGNVVCLMCRAASNADFS